MKDHERQELLGCAQRVAAALQVEPANLPIEGYYVEEPELRTYFRLLRALQKESRSRTVEVESLSQPPATDTYANIFGRHNPTIVGRCVCVAVTTDSPPAYYHWAVVKEGEQYGVHEFWAPELWTTERYRAGMQSRS